MSILTQSRTEWNNNVGVKIISHLSTTMDDSWLIVLVKRELQVDTKVSFYFAN